MMDIQDLLQKMTLEEKCSLLSGGGFNETQAIERLGLRELKMCDGPNGLRLQIENEDHMGLAESVPSTCFPTGCAMASTWDRELVREMAAAIGREYRHHDVSVILGPAINIKRSPLCGRNFEYYSEDPYLSAQLAEAYIEGAQSEGVGTSVKHLTANNQETHRLTMDTVVDERTLREIYLASFESSVRRAKPWSVMCAYNRLNGEYASEHAWLLNKVLREDWGYEGVMVTDWGAVNDRVKGLLAGQDLEMPSSGTVNDDKVRAAVESGAICEAEVDRAVKRYLQMYALCEEGAAGREDTFDPEENHRLAVRCAAEGMVLLKNGDLDGRPVLPLQRGDRVVVMGPFAKKPRFQGGGSSHLEPGRVSLPLEELRRTGGENVLYAEGQEALEALKGADRAVIFAGLPEVVETEGLDRDSLDLPGDQLELIRKAAEICPGTVVFLSCGSPVAMPFADKVPAIVMGYLSGEGVGEAAAEVLYGLRTPCGKLAETFPVRLEDTPCYLDFPGHDGRVEYREGIFVGYRWYDSRKIRPLFPFGFGLSYTQFQYSDLRIAPAGEAAAVSGGEPGEAAYVLREDTKLCVTVRVTNTGDTEGREIVQLYVHDRQQGVQRPEKELKGFAKILLLPGESRDVEMVLDYRSFAFYDTAAGDWFVQEGGFDILIGASSEDLRLSKTIILHPEKKRIKRFTATSPFGQMLEYAQTCGTAEEIYEYFKRESGIDWDLGERAPDFAFRVISDFPLKALVSFTQGRFSEEQLEALLEKLNRAAGVREDAT